MLNGIIPNTWQPQLHAALRIMAGLLFVEHGTTKLLHWPATDMFPAGQPLPSLMLVAGILEVVGGLMVTVGLFTRVAAFVLAGMMAAAYFMAHLPTSLFPVQNSGDAAVLFCFIFLFLASAGSGAYSIDATREA
jgi:putative oxidoreductase